MLVITLPLHAGLYGEGRVVEVAAVDRGQALVRGGEGVVGGAICGRRHDMT